ncbi:MAG TPA: hypothetical protein QF656_02920 [Nitrosopumilus sp.]|nr:hypothetical protein [Nitrosopumilus sp.]
MSVDINLLKNLMSFTTEHSPKFVLHLNGNDYSLIDVFIENSSIPVTEPTTRGGAYFSEKYAYKMKGVVDDLEIVPLLSKKMLGPNTEFGELKVTTEIQHDGKLIHLDILTNLTNSVQTPNSIELSMIIVELKFV